MSGVNGWTIDWRDKGFPPAAGEIEGTHVGEQGWRLGEDFLTPVAVLTESAMAHNLARMRDYCAEQGVAIAPHGKTTMSPDLIRRQLEHGAWGVTAATAWQARAMLMFGVKRVLIANECLDPVGLRFLAEQVRDHPEISVFAFVDSLTAVSAMRAVLRDLGGARPFPVLVEVGAAGKRAGARDVRSAVRVGRAVALAPELELAGVGCFEGVLGGTRTPDVVERVRELLSDARRAAEELIAADAFRPGHPVILTAGGSAFFDQVVDVFTADRRAYGRPVEVVIRSGCYVTHDHGSYRASSPFAGAGEQEFRPALHVWARVISMPEPGLAIIDAGKRDVSADGKLPIVVGRYRDGDHIVADGVPGLDGVVVDRFNDQHGYLVLPADSDALRVGDLVVLGVSHPCTTFDKWRAIPVVDDDLRVVAAVRTFF